MPRKKVVFIVKYFYPIKRPSGISSFVYELANEIAHNVDLSVVSYKKETDNEREYQHNGYKIYKTNRPFPLEASKIANQTNPDTVIIFSGIYEPVKTMLYFGFTSLTLKCKNVAFCQATNYNKEKLPGYYKMFLKRFRKIIATNEYMGNQYKQLGVEAKNIPPGVNVDSILSLSKGEVVKPKEVRVGFFGHFYKIKGPDRLLNSFLLINPSNADLVINGGNGELKKEIVEAANKDSRISVIGWQENIIPYIASCDIMVLPYRESYSVLGYSQAALEAMALSIPVIGTKTPSLEFLIKNGYNGYIVKNDNELKERLEYLMSDQEKIKELGANARQTVVENYSIKKITNEYLNKVI